MTLYWYRNVKMKERTKKPTPGCIWTHDLTIIRNVLNRWVTTAALKIKKVRKVPKTWPQTFDQSWPNFTSMAAVVLDDEGDVGVVVPEVDLPRQVPELVGFQVDRTLRNFFAFRILDGPVWWSSWQKQLFQIDYWSLESFLKVATTQVNLLFIELMSHLSNLN